ncbi:hypothetical protein JYG23_08350 [Sedimentibacter sp. zth1]|uniref:hypothetical protein n=1 Tax=Sedimentibacter sp. zth1 TaxID=2816908 RepID=UPI001A92BA7D|nr:hypothetical protein [Sedimentibacter sp. zth1]QSX07410.1 hypothetical protein JYG23_08350 [Sedimentibacter sp. zth1]
MFGNNKVKKVLSATRVNMQNAPEKIELEKNDMLALIIAGFVALLPALLVVLVLIIGVSLFFLR